jgi:hypothetical protein
MKKRSHPRVESVSEGEEEYASLDAHGHVRWRKFNLHIAIVDQIRRVQRINHFTFIARLTSFLRLMNIDAMKAASEAFRADYVSFSRTGLGRDIRLSVFRRKNDMAKYILIEGARVLTSRS